MKFGRGIRRNIAQYDRDAEKLALKYDALSTPASLPLFCAKVAELGGLAGKRALDIGCGTGRDALWMARQGLSVTGVDGSSEMLRIAKDTKPHAQVDYIHDLAPDFARLAGKKFDVILANAFLFHLDGNERAAFYDRLKEMAAPGAFAYLTLRHGPVPEGRVMYEIDPQELADWAQAQGFKCLNLGRDSDALGRGGVAWDHIVIEF